MRRLIAIALPAVLLLGAPVSASAKGIMGASVCGADGCREVPKPDYRLLEGGSASDPPDRPEPFVRVTIRVGVPDHVEPVRLVFLPASGLVLAEDGTTWTRAAALRELRGIARRVMPFAASDLPKAVAIAESATASAREPLPPEVVEAPAPAVATASDGGFDAWWLVLPAGAIVLAAGLVVARRRRREPPPTAAGAVG